MDTFVSSLGALVVGAGVLFVLLVFSPVCGGLLKLGSVALFLDVMFLLFLIAEGPSGFGSPAALALCVAVLVIVNWLSHRFYKDIDK